MVFPDVLHELFGVQRMLCTVQLIRELL